MQDTAGVIAPPPLIYLGGLVAGLLLDVWFRVVFLPTLLSRWLGGTLIGISLLLGVCAIITMRRAGTAVRPDRPTTALVVNGPFRFTRNPGYLSMTFLYAGIVIWRNSVWALLALPVVLIVIHYYVIHREERYLERKFGHQYLQYKSQVRRWI